MGTKKPDKIGKILNSDFKEVFLPAESIVDKNGKTVEERLDNMTKSDVGLNNVDNTSDKDKPVSAAVRKALSDKVDKNTLGKPGGGATLGQDGKLNPTQMPPITLENSPYVSVKDFGAVGDGITDDTAAFQAAINGAASQRRMLFLNEGTYLITDRLIIEEPLTITGGNHDECIVMFQGSYHPETPYDPEYYEESNACFIVKPDNCSFINFTIIGGTKANPSSCNGIVLHYPFYNTDTQKTVYKAAERFYCHQVDIKCFKNGIFLYAGWNRGIERCNFLDNSEAGIKWYSLEKETLGVWSCSGDRAISCQFVGNRYGVYLDGARVTVIDNGTFEYNDRAIYADNCTNLMLINCWNEQNYGKIYIRGSAKFIGEYDINPGTIEHVLIGGHDIVTIMSDTSTIVYSDGEIKYKQDGGIVTKGYEPSAEVENMVSNPYFEQVSGGTGTVPSAVYWEPYPAWAFNVSTEVRNEGRNSIHMLVRDQTTDVHYSIAAEDIPVDPTKEYSFSVNVMSYDRSTMNAGYMVYVAWRDGSHNNCLIISLSAL